MPEHIGTALAARLQAEEDLLAAGGALLSVVLYGRRFEDDELPYKC